MTQKEILSTWTNDMQTIKGEVDNTLSSYNTLKYVADEAIKRIENGEAVIMDTYIREHIQRVIVVVSNTIERHNRDCYRISMSEKDKFICAYNLLYDTICDYVAA